MVESNNYLTRDSLAYHVRHLHDSIIVYMLISSENVFNLLKESLLAIWMRRQQPSRIGERRRCCLVACHEHHVAVRDDDVMVQWFLLGDKNKL